MIRIYLREKKEEAMSTDSIIYDGHIHINAGDSPDALKFVRECSRAGVGGGLVISPPPGSSPVALGVDIPAQKRMTMTRDFCEACGKTFFPCFWIDPLDPKAPVQVKHAKEMGIRALKVICSTHAPSAGLPVYREAVKYDLPILFHSGILWDGKDSGRYNRPCEFECLLEASGLRFTLAHVSWPWTEECAALFGKLQNGGRKYNKNLTFFIDDSPGIPDIARREAFRNFAFIGYDLREHLIFGTDNNTLSYNWEWAKYMLDFDRDMFADLNREFQDFNGYLAVSRFRDGKRPDLNEVYQNSIHKNLLRFIGEI